MKLFRCTAPHFVAGYESANGVVCRTAPILNYLVGWFDFDVWLYFQRKGWNVETLEQRA